MNKMRGAIIILVLCVAVVLLGLLNSRGLNGAADGAKGETTVVGPSETLKLSDKKLSCFHVDGGVFTKAMEDARSYSVDEIPLALVVPHHMTAASLVSGAFSAASERTDYDSVIIVAPNHEGDIADVILTDKGWSVGDGVDCDASLLESLTGEWKSSAEYAYNDERMEEDHSASSLVPFADAYIKDAEVMPILVSKSLTLDETLYIADTLYSVVSGSGKNVLLICSVDFSHYLTPKQSRERDSQTLEAVKHLDYAAIHSFTNDNLDSPAALIIFLRYLELQGREAKVLDNTDASSFSDTPVSSTTSYFVLAG